ncbi:MAG TPA: macro domain-containing protein [Terriglobia bacterium]|nr:macro domain-containing protein [Terriglobia bacterium]
MPTKVLFAQGDITDMAVDAIVNAANTELTMEAGVAAAIRRKAGEHVLEECERLAPIRLGATAVTTGGNLRAHFVIHAAGMRPGEKATTESIRLATRASLMRAEEKAIRSLAFPALGTGVAGLPIADCAAIMLKVTLDHIKMRTSLEKIYFVLFDEAALKVFEGTFQQLTGRPAPAGDTRA